MHPKYTQYASSKYKNGLLDGSWSEICFLHRDRYNKNNVDRQIFGDLCEQRFDIIASSGSVNQMIQLELFPNGCKYKKYFSPLCSIEPPLKKVKKYKSELSPKLCDKFGIELGTKEWRIHNKYEYINKKLEQIKPTDRLGPGFISSWEQRKTPAEDKTHNIKVELANRNVAQDLKLTLIGLASRTLPKWPESLYDNANASGSFVMNADGHSSTIRSKLNEAIGVGNRIRRLREAGNMSIHEHNPSSQSTGLISSEIVQFLERVVLSLDGDMTRSILKGKSLGELAHYITTNRTVLATNEECKNLGELTSLKSPSDAFYVHALFIMIKSSMRPLLGAVNLWLFEGVWTGVIDSLIDNNSRFSIARDRSYWLQTYIKRDNISPFFIRDAENILLIGKTLNLLRLLAPGHHLLSLDYQDMLIVLRNLENITEYELRILDIQSENYECQINYETEYFEAERKKCQNLQNERKAENEYRDKKIAERKEAERKHEMELKETTKKDLLNQIEQNRLINIEKRKQEEIEKKDRENILLMKDKIIEEEKQRMIQEHEIQMGNLSTKGNIQNYSAQSSNKSFPVIPDSDKKLDVLPNTELIERIETVLLDDDDLAHHSDTLKTAAVRNKAHNMSHTPFGSNLRQDQEEECMDTTPNRIPRRKPTQNSAFQSAFVTGSMELRRNVSKKKKKSSELSKITDEEYMQMATNLTKQTIQAQIEIKSTKPKYLKLNGIETAKLNMTGNMGKRNCFKHFTMITDF